MASPLQAAIAVSPRVKAISELLAKSGEPEWRLKQVLQGMYKSYRGSWRDLDGVPKSLKWKLKDHFGRYISSLKRKTKVEGDFAEKIGCAFGCAFCATGKVGLKRQMDADEITDQVLYFFQMGQKIDSVSFMGMGEPLANPKIFDALSILTSPDLYGMSTRRMNVSTVGVVPGILKLTEEFPQANLAFSLHSPFTEQRNRLVPLNKMYPLEQVFEVLDHRIKKTGRQIWVAYLLLRGQNDSLEHARAVADLIRQRPAETRYLYHINLLPYNVGRAVPEQYRRAEEEAVSIFQRVLEENRISCSYRNSFGHSIDAACGQLFAGYEERMPIVGAARPASSGLAQRSSFGGAKSTGGSRSARVNEAGPQQPAASASSSSSSSSPGASAASSSSAASDGGPAQASAAAATAVESTLGEASATAAEASVAADAAKAPPNLQQSSSPGVAAAAAAPAR